jgi:hypothetical protein
MRELASASNRARQSEDSRSMAVCEIPQIKPHCVGGGDGCQNCSGVCAPLERFDYARLVRTPGKFVDVGCSGLCNEGDSARVADCPMEVETAKNGSRRGFTGGKFQETADLPAKLLKIMVGTTGFEPATSSVSRALRCANTVIPGICSLSKTLSGTPGNAYCSLVVPTQSNVGNLTATRTSWPPTHLLFLAWLTGSGNRNGRGPSMARIEVNVH